MADHSDSEPQYTRPRRGRRVTRTLLAAVAAAGCTPGGEQTTPTTSPSPETTLRVGTSACINWVTLTNITAQQVREAGVKVDGKQGAPGDARRSPHRVVIRFPDDLRTTEGVAFIRPDGSVEGTAIIAGDGKNHQINLGVG